MEKNINNYLNNKTKINNYKALNIKVDKKTIKFQKNYPFLFAVLENNIRANLENLDQRIKENKIIFEIPSNYRLLYSFLYQFFFLFISKFFYFSNRESVIITLPNFNNLSFKFRERLKKKSINILTKNKSFSILQIFNVNYIFFTPLGLPICNYKALKKLFLSKNFELNKFYNHELKLLNRSEALIKKHLVRLSKIYKYRNIKSIFATGASSYSSSCLCLAAKQSKIIYTILAHGYISNPELITIAPIRSNFLLVWTKNQQLMLKEKVEEDEKDKIIYLGYPGDKLHQNTHKSANKILFAYEPIDKLNEIEPRVIQDIRNFHENITKKYDCIFRPHPKDANNLNAFKDRLGIDSNLLSFNSLNQDLANAKIVISSNSSVLIHANLNNIYSFQIEEAMKTLYDGVPCYNINKILSILPKIIKTEKKSKNVDYLIDNFDALEKILFNT